MIVEIRRFSDDKVEHAIWCRDKSLSQVERVEDGVLGRIDLDKFYTRIVDANGPEKSDG